MTPHKAKEHLEEALRHIDKVKLGIRNKEVVASCKIVEEPLTTLIENIVKTCSAGDKQGRLIL